MIWNVRGVASLSTVCRLKRLCTLHSLSILVLVELFISADKLPFFSNRLHFSNTWASNNNKILVFVACWFGG